MLVCALEVRRSGLGLVLMADEPGEAPQFLEGQHFPRWVEPDRVLAQLEAWEAYYGSKPEAVAWCSRDEVPEELLEALRQAGQELEPVDAAELREAERVWRELRPDPRWNRAALTALLVSSPRLYLYEDDNAWRTAWDWVYACLRRQVLDVEAWLLAGGRLMCPGHLRRSCPRCQFSPGEGWLPAPFVPEPEGDPQAS
jgi:hypothetical protein